MHGLGIDLPLIPVDRWRDRLRAALDDTIDNPLRPLGALFFRKATSNATSVPADTYLYGRVPAMDSSRTIAQLSALGVAAPTVDATLLNALSPRLTGQITVEL